MRRSERVSYSYLRRRREAGSGGNERRGRGRRARRTCRLGFPCGSPKAG